MTDDEAHQHAEQEMNPALAPADSREQRDQATHDDADRPLIVRSADLLQGRRELWIEHGDDMYRLRLTSAGKLYLTK